MALDRPGPLPVAVAIMAKAPWPGGVKTRLCPPLDPAEAAALYESFLRDKIAQVRTLGRAHPVLAYTPAESRPRFAELAPDFTLLAQRGDTLGERLGHVWADLLAAGHRAAIAIDSDTPTLPTEFLESAVEVAPRGDADVVLGPTDDGGYYLIGGRALHRQLFDGIPWSTSQVLAETLRRAAAAGLRTMCLPAWFDVDTADDLARLRASLAGRGGGARPQHTERFLNRAARARPA